MASSSDISCVSCHNPLTLLVESDEVVEDSFVAGAGPSDQDSYVDDDVLMQCGCHFHWSVVSIGVPISH